MDEGACNNKIAFPKITNVNSSHRVFTDFLGSTVAHSTGSQPGLQRGPRALSVAGIHCSLGGDWVDTGPSLSALAEGS